MNTSQKKLTCFIAMPVSTPEDWVDIYSGDKEHFKHVLEYLFEPAVKDAGFTPIPPKSTGSNIIHADIIQNLSKCDLVLGDMSALNLNVFFELGIRTALNKPVVLVKDDQTPERLIPFDTHIVNYHTYDSRNFPWNIEEQVRALAEHIRVSYEKNNKSCALWEHFGVLESAVFSTRKATADDKLNFILKSIKSIEGRLTELEYFARPEEQLISSNNLASALAGENHISIKDLAREITRTPLTLKKMAVQMAEEKKARENFYKKLRMGTVKPLTEQVHPEQHKKQSPEKK